jgi:hypothetical protein
MLESTQTFERPPHTRLRYVAILPAAVVGALVGPALVYVYQWLFGDQHPSRFDELVTVIGQSIAMGAVFVWAGTYTAPAYKGRVAIALAGMAIFVFGGMAVLFVISHQWWNLIHVLISALAAGFVGYTLHGEHE